MRLGTVADDEAWKGLFFKGTFRGFRRIGLLLELEAFDECLFNRIFTSTRKFQDAYFQLNFLYLMVD